MKKEISKYYPCLDKRLVAQHLVSLLNKNLCKGHSWQRDNNGNIYIDGPFIFMKL